MTHTLNNITVSSSLNTVLTVCVGTEVVFKKDIQTEYEDKIRGIIARNYVHEIFSYSDEAYDIAEEVINAVKAHTPLSEEGEGALLNLLSEHIEDIVLYAYNDLYADEVKGIDEANKEEADKRQYFLENR